MSQYRKETSINGYTLAFETGEIAKQAGGAVMMHNGETSVLCTVCASFSPREGVDFSLLLLITGSFSMQQELFPAIFFGVKRDRERERH